MSDCYFSVNGLVSYGGLSERTIRGYLVHPSTPLPHYRVGGKILVKRSEFDSWMANFKVNEPSRADAVAVRPSEFEELVVEHEAQPSTCDGDNDEMGKLVAAAVRGIRGSR